MSQNVSSAAVVTGALRVKGDIKLKCRLIQNLDGALKVKALQCPTKIQKRESF